MGSQLFSNAFPYIEKKYLPYSTDKIKNPIANLISNIPVQHQELTTQTKFLMSGKIRVLLRSVQLEQQNILDKMSLEYNQEANFTEQIENLSIAIENLEATTKSFLYTEETDLAVDSFRTQEENAKSKIVRTHTQLG